MSIYLLRLYGMFFFSANVSGAHTLELVHVAHWSKLHNKSHTSAALNEDTSNAVMSLPKSEIKKQATNKSYLNTTLFQRHSPHH